jgi:hypothetical protein
MFYILLFKLRGLRVAEPPSSWIVPDKIIPPPLYEKNPKYATDTIETQKYRARACTTETGRCYAAAAIFGR